LMRWKQLLNWRREKTSLSRPLRCQFKQHGFRSAGAARTSVLYGRTLWPATLSPHTEALGH
jgi:hypothetical protein